LTLKTNFSLHKETGKGNRFFMRVKAYKKLMENYYV
jgi:hypothetical protein